MKIYTVDECRDWPKAQLLPLADSSFSGIQKVLDSEEILLLVHLSDSGRLNNGRDYHKFLRDDQRQALWVLFYSSGPVSGEEDETEFRQTAMCDTSKVHFLSYGIAYRNAEGIVPARFILDRITCFTAGDGLSPKERWEIVDPIVPLHVLALYLLLRAVREMSIRDYEAVVYAWDGMDTQWRETFWNNVHNEYLKWKREFDGTGSALAALAQRFGRTSPSARDVSLDIYRAEAHDLGALERATQFKWDYFRHCNPSWEAFHRSWHDWLKNGVLDDIDAWLTDPTVELSTLSEEDCADEICRLRNAHSHMIESFDPAGLVGASPLVCLSLDAQAIVKASLSEIYHTVKTVDKLHVTLGRSINEFERHATQVVSSGPTRQALRKKQVNNCRRAALRLQKELQTITHNVGLIL